VIRTTVVQLARLPSETASSFQSSMTMPAYKDAVRCEKAQYVQVRSEMERAPSEHRQTVAIWGRW
jgi:hypothetical protein